MIVDEISIPTPDGAADGYAVYPSKDGKYPAVIFEMDGIGLRPALVDLARGIAAQGYYVLLPNLFYRHGKAPLFDVDGFLAGTLPREEVWPKLMPMIEALTPERVENDAHAFMVYLEKQPQADTRAIAVAGFCMGGSIALRTAALYPKRVVAAASFHGSRLATDDPSSPHLLVDHIEAELYLGHAINDQSCPQEQVDKLEAALNKADVKHQTEMYEAQHGWTMPDLPWAKNEAAADKAWNRLYELLGRTLKQPAGAGR